MKKKTSKSQKDGAIHATFNGHSWKTKYVTPEELEDVFKSVADQAKKQLEERYLPLEKLTLNTVRIVVAVAETATWWDGDVKKSKKLETGRAMAQACHAVSKLKLSYAMWLAQGKTEDCYGIVQKIMLQPITCIVVKARDTDELLHIDRLAGEARLHCVGFKDDNPEFYKSIVWPLTAIAIGPYTYERFEGITDYLPLWKSPDEL